MRIREVISLIVVTAGTSCSLNWRGGTQPTKKQTASSFSYRRLHSHIFNKLVHATILKQLGALNCHQHAFVFILEEFCDLWYTHHKPMTMVVQLTCATSGLSAWKGSPPYTTSQPPSPYSASIFRANSWSCESGAFNPSMSLYRARTPYLHRQRCELVRKRMVQLGPRCTVTRI